MFSCVYSMKGSKHNVNQDSFRENREKGLFMVADGMGGYMAGEIASSETCDIIEECIDEFSKESIRKAITKANERIYEKGRDKEHKGMGTTIALCLIHDDEMYAAHVGDSRIYIINEKVKSVTRDHSLVEELIDRGDIKKEDADGHSLSNVITRAIGAEQRVNPDIARIKLKEEDTILICSDGMCKNISNGAMLEIFKSNKMEDIPRILCETAVKNGSTDDITVMVVYRGQEGEET